MAWHVVLSSAANSQPHEWRRPRPTIRWQCCHLLPPGQQPAEAVLDRATQSSDARRTRPVSLPALTTAFGMFWQYLGFQSDAGGPPAHASPAERLMHCWLRGRLSLLQQLPCIPAVLLLQFNQQLLVCRAGIVGRGLPSRLCCCQQLHALPLLRMPCSRLPAHATSLQTHGTRTASEAAFKCSRPMTAR